MDVTLWPDSPYPAWRDTAATLQLWTQIVGKVRLALTPWLNHGWQVPLYVTARGLSTSPIPVGYESSISSATASWPAPAGARNGRSRLNRERWPSFIVA